MKKKARNEGSHYPHSVSASVGVSKWDNRQDERGSESGKHSNSVDKQGVKDVKTKVGSFFKPTQKSHDFSGNVSWKLAHGSANVLEEEKGNDEELTHVLYKDICTLCQTKAKKH